MVAGCLAVIQVSHVMPDRRTIEPGEMALVALVAALAAATAVAACLPAWALARRDLAAVQVGRMYPAGEWWLQAARRSGRVAMLNAVITVALLALAAAIRFL